MQAPGTFAEWSDLFDRLRTAGYEDELLKAAREGTFEWEPVTADLWAEELMKTIQARINMAKKRFDRDYSNSKGNEGAIDRALIQLKKDLRYAMSLSEIPCIPDEQRPVYADEVQKTAEQFANSLEETAKTGDRTGKILMLIKKADIRNLN